MSDQKDKAQQKKRMEDSDDKGESGFGVSGGNMGAGRSGKEGMGSEKPTDHKGMGSHKPGEVQESEGAQPGGDQETESEKSGVTDEEETT